MFSPRLRFRLLVPILVGAGLLFVLPQLPPLVALEHRAFNPPERFHPESRYLESGPHEDFVLKVHEFGLPPDHPANIGTYRIDQETLDIMGADQGDPLEWAQLLRQTRLPDDRLIVVTSSLSWPDALEIPLRALQAQIEQTPCLVVGLRGELLNTASPLPPELASSVIPFVPESLTLPEIDHLPAPPSVTARLFGISEVRGLKIEKEGQHQRLPMLVRWGKHVLPSLQLASLLTLNGLSPDDLIVDPAGYLRLGRDGLIIPTDSFGFAFLPCEETPPRSASQLQIYPTRGETTKIIEPEPPPIPARALASQLQALNGKPPELVKTYQRWPPLIELTFLVLPAFLLAGRRRWLYLPAILVITAASLVFSRWYLLAPPLALLVLHLILQRLPRGDRPQATRS